MLQREQGDFLKLMSAHASDTEPPHTHAHIHTHTRMQTHKERKEKFREGERECVREREVFEGPAVEDSRVTLLIVGK